METTRDLFESLRRGIDQNGRLLKLDTLLGKNVFLPHRLVAEDRLGRGYEYKLDVLTLKKTLSSNNSLRNP